MRKLTMAAIGVVMSAAVAEAEVAAMKTVWGERVTSANCWREYPRPQMVRDNWTCLNGDWEYAITSVTNTPGRPKSWMGKIRVPYAIESVLSGVGRPLQPDEFLWYTRKIEVRKRPNERTLLHFDGVDFRAMVFIGHDEVTDVPHEGAQEPFTLDITDYVKDGENELTVCVWDPTGSSGDAFTTYNSRGKQDFRTHDCFYTRVSGIWQTVWMETVPEKYIRDYRVFTDIDRGTVRFEFDKVGEGEVKVVHDMPKAFECWSPENPKLYHFTAKFGKDEVKGYFAMRKFDKRKDAKGVLRFHLNNVPYFIIGTLDQGWWPDGLLTPPSEEAMIHDIRTLKECGFNMMRKHIKVEPRRYYHNCDRLGLIVLQDLPCHNGRWDGHLDSRHVFGYGFQRLELKRMIDGLQKVPSIVMWIPFNEGWAQPGEFLTHSTLDWVRRYDPTRLVDGPSGCNDWEGGHRLVPPDGWRWDARIETKHKPAGECEAADAVDMHLYRGPAMFAVNDRRVSFLGEFGGLGHPVAGHLWAECAQAVPYREQNSGRAGSWGYGGIEDTKTREGLEKAYLGLMDKVAEFARAGLGGSVYTQTTDVEIEINGLMTYDRKVLKFNPSVLKAAHARIVEAAVEAAAEDRRGCEDFDRYVEFCRETALASAATDGVGEAVTTRQFNKDYKIVYADKDYLSFYTKEHSYLGGAHGSTLIRVGTISRATGRIVRTADFVPAERKDALRAALRAGAVKVLQGEEHLQSEVTVTENFYLAEDGLHFIYNEYEIACYAAGAVEVVIDPKAL